MSALFLIAAAALVSTGPAPSSPLPASGGFGSPPTRRELAGDPNEMICKHIVTTGTHLARSQCRTRAAWNQLGVDSREAMRDLTANQGGLNQLSAGSKFNGK